MTISLRPPLPPKIGSDRERVETRRTLISARRACCVHSIQAITMKCIWQLFALTACTVACTHWVHLLWNLSLLFALCMARTYCVRTPYGLHLLCLYLLWNANTRFLLSSANTESANLLCALTMIRTYYGVRTPGGLFPDFCTRVCHLGIANRTLR